MNYVFNFRELIQYWPDLLAGIWLTVQISVISIIIGAVLGIALAVIHNSSPAFVRIFIDAYVEIIRNTPFLVHLFLIYFGLPLIGIKITAFGASIIGMSLNIIAYGTEIVRGGIEAIHKSQIEAAEALGFNRLQIYRHVIIMPALQKVYPSLCSQFVLMMLASSVCSAISLEELTATAANIESTSYRAFEIYIVVTLLYVALAIGMRFVLALIGLWLFGKKRSRRPQYSTIEEAGA